MSESKSNIRRYMNQKFVGLLIILLGTIALLSFGFITPEIFQTVMLWGFTIFAGSDTIEVGSVQFKEFMESKAYLEDLSSKQ